MINTPGSIKKCHDSVTRACFLRRNTIHRAYTHIRGLKLQEIHTDDTQETHTYDARTRLYSRTPTHMIAIQAQMAADREAVGLSSTHLLARTLA